MSYSPTDPSREGNYDFDATSQMWKDVCSPYPCFESMHWTNYVQSHIDIKIKGKPAVIQAWKGLCPQFIPDFTLREPYGHISFPGGFGAEVGVYRRLTEPPKPALLELGAKPDLPADWPLKLRTAVEAWLHARILNLDRADPGHVWFPADDLVKKSGGVTMRMSDPLYPDTPLIDSYFTNTYWTCKWMRVHSYCDWAAAMNKSEGFEFNLPGMSLPSYYKLEFTVAGVEYIWDDPTGIRKKK